MAELLWIQQNVFRPVFRRGGGGILYRLVVCRQKVWSDLQGLSNLRRAYRSRTLPMHFKDFTYVAS